MTKLLIIRKLRDPDEFCARYLRPGMIVPIGDKTARVRSVTVMNGENGEPPAMVGGGGKPSAMALKVEFYDREPIIAHPSAVVNRPHTERPIVAAVVISTVAALAIAATMFVASCTKERPCLSGGASYLPAHR